MIDQLEYNNLVSFFSDKSLDNQLQIKTRAYELAAAEENNILDNAVAEAELQRDDLNE